MNASALSACVTNSSKCFTMLSVNNERGAHNACDKSTSNSANRMCTHLYSRRSITRPPTLCNQSIIPDYLYLTIQSQRIGHTLMNILICSTRWEIILRAPHVITPDRFTELSIIDAYLIAINYALTFSEYVFLSENIYRQQGYELVWGAATLHKLLIVSWLYRKLFSLYR